MSNNFEENNKFFNTDGTINRRTFITNLLITEIFEALVYSTPMLILLIINPDIMSSIMKSAIQTGMFPRWLAIYCFVVWIMKIGLLYPSIVKRIRDITGNYDNTNWVFAVLAFSVCNCNLPYGTKRQDFRRASEKRDIQVQLGSNVRHMDMGVNQQKLHYSFVHSVIFHNRFYSVYDYLRNKRK